MKAALPVAVALVLAGSSAALAAPTRLEAENAVISHGVVGRVGFEDSQFAIGGHGCPAHVDNSQWRAQP